MSIVKPVNRSIQEFALMLILITAVPSMAFAIPKNTPDNRHIQANGAQTDPFPTEDNHWHLGYSVNGYSSDGKYSQLANWSRGDQSSDNPAETNTVYTDLTNKLVLQTPPTGCANTGPASTNACTFVSDTANQDDDHHISYDFRYWGGRCAHWLNVMVYPPQQFWKWGDVTPWSSGSPFIVIVPEQVSSPMVFGKLHGRNIFFTPSNPLSATDSKSFKLIDVESVSGLGTVYRFQTK